MLCYVVTVDESAHSKTPKHSERHARYHLVTTFIVRRPCSGRVISNRKIAVSWATPTSTRRPAQRLIADQRSVRCYGMPAPPAGREGQGRWLSSSQFDVSPSCWQQNVRSAPQCKWRK